MKIGYRLLTDNDSLWTQVLKTKYKWSEVMSLSIGCRVCSRLWTRICSIWDYLKECISWDIRDGNTTDFWYDQWIGKDDRRALSCLMTATLRPLMVAEMMSEIGERDWDRLVTILPRERLERTASVHPPRSGSERVRCHIVTSELCEICGGGREDVEHVLTFCFAARGVWMRALPPEVMEGRCLGIVSMNFVLLPADIATLVEEELMGAPSAIIMPLLEVTETSLANGGVV
ncbi:hypothetical protein V6N11_014294 [Hibiscus sabdariffa]|uniref:Reverse transcriptase zinc-binding domain-containing protein n=1 Tax=Hibiscus sabdariffa TaxID=183260 RepID=A0ABR1ZHH7_9ROSI